MDDLRDLLMDTFTAHQPPAPDTVSVLSNVDAIAKTQRRNRWALRATGVSLLGAGIVAGSVGLPGVFSHGSGNTGQSLVAAAGSGPSDGASPSGYTYNQEIAEFSRAGYDYNNAATLAQLWHMSDAFMNKVKAKAGLKLLEGESLPVKPDNPVTPAAQSDEQAAAAFFGAGYDYTDAKSLAKMWHVSTYGAKVKAGKDIESRTPVPIQPSGSASSHTDRTTKPTPAGIAKLKGKKMRTLSLVGASAAGNDSQALAAYFDAGYDYSNAQQLAKLWHESDITQVKTQAGQQLLAGDTLPVKPAGQPAPPDNKAVDAFFGAGYDYNDAVKLGKMWNQSTYRAKIEGGKKIENGETLPIKPGS